MNYLTHLKRRRVTTSVHRRKIGSLECLERRTVLSLAPFTFGDGELTVSGDALYFVAGGGPGTFGQVWKTDGTLEGTDQLTFQSGSFRPEALTDLNGRLMFRGATWPEGVELWRSDGTPGGTRFVADVNPNNQGGPGPQDLTNINGTLYFTGGWWSDVELWRSDGTAAGTYRVANINPTGSSGPHNMTAFKGDVFFTANDGVHGYELWRSDGTAAGTQLVKDINPGSLGAGEENITNWRMTVAGDQLFFIAGDGEHGRELWTSDGTAEGTHLVLDITTGPANNVYELVAYNDELYFTVGGDAAHEGLWRSDGTAEGTTRVKPLLGVWGMAVAGDALYFAGSDGEHGAELWKSFGTSESTVMVADVRPGPDGSGPATITPAPLPGGGWVVFYTATDGGNSMLYKSDGTAAGTVVVRHHVEVGWPSELVYFDGSIYFASLGLLWRTSVVNAGPPVADAGGPYSIVEGQSLSLDASATTDPDPDDILEYAWDINGDGDFGDARGVVTTLTWHQLELLGLNTAADWQVKVRVRDGNGGETISAPAPLTITMLPPVVTAVTLAASQGQPFVPKFTGLGDLPGGDFRSFATTISADGQVIAGYGATPTSAAEPFRWTSQTGLISLGLPQNIRYMIPTDSSADGSVLVAFGMSSFSVDEIYGGAVEVFTQLRESAYSNPNRWTAASGFVQLGSPEGGFGSETPTAVSADGTVAVGTAYWDDGFLGVQWDAAGQPTVIGGPSLWSGEPGGPAYAVSGDGRVVFGVGQSYSGVSGLFYWTPETGAVELGVNGQPVTASADSSVVVGNLGGQGGEPNGIFIARPNFDCASVEVSSTRTSSPTTGSACSGSASTTVLPDDGHGYVAWDASSDASVIVGSSSQGAFIWDRQHGFRLVADVLRENGYSLEHWTLTAATGISADGLVLVGYGTNAAGNSEAWRVDLSPVVRPAVGSGEQLRPLGQVGLDQVSISFSEDVTVSADDLTVTGANVTEYDVSQFAYDSGSHTAVWRLAQPIGADAVQITLRSGADGVRDLASLDLDAEWDNPTSIGDPNSDTFPSGDGAPGGDFVFQFNALPGDVDGDGVVGRRDLATLVQQGFKRQGDPGFDARLDLDGDGAIGALDAMFARDHLGDSLPGVAAAPSAVQAHASGSSAGGLRRIAASRQRLGVATPQSVDAAFNAEVSTSPISTLRSTRRRR